MNYGTGHIFRQCIGNSEIDFRRYDEIFYLTKREDAAETVLLLAMSRLRYPYRLQEKHREVYLDYLRGAFALGGGVFHGAEGGGNPAAVRGLGTADGGNHTRIDCPCAEKGADGSAELFDGLSA